MPRQGLSGEVSAWDEAREDMGKTKSKTSSTETHLATFREGKGGQWAVACSVRTGLGEQSGRAFRPLGNAFYS